MNYIFCGGYKALLFSLYFKNVLNEEITIVTNNVDIIQYCEAEKINCIHFEPIRPTILKIFKLVNNKKTLDNVVKQINLGKQDRFFMTGKAVMFEPFYIAKELAGKGKIYYKHLDREYNIFKPSRFKPIFVRGFIKKFFIKLILGFDLIFYETNKAPRLGVDDKFLDKYNITEYPPKLNSEVIIHEAVKKTKSKYKSYDNLIVDQGLMGGIVKLDSVMDLFKKLCNLNFKFTLKKHPKLFGKLKSNEQQYYNIFKNCEEVPRYIPVELFYNNIKKNVISICSAALITASQFDHLKAISMIELVKWENESYKKEFKKYLITESKNNIIFPTSFEELKKIL